MTSDAYRTAILDISYLAACATEGRTPDPERVGRMDLSALYQTAERHQLTGITAMALESAGVTDEAFVQAKGKAIRKVATFDLERAAVLAGLEKAGIWYAPLKGCVLEKLYPKIGMRQMADNDILCDPLRMEDVRAVMEGLGFSTDRSWGRSVHDHFFKPPVCNFEMHRMLFGPGHDKRIAAYYREVKDRLLPDGAGICGYCFSDEDFYLYLLAHEFKHYSNGGTGLRSLLDTYVFLKRKGDSLDWHYIEGELDQLGIAGFEEKNRSLALHLFDGAELTEEDREMLNYMASSGTYGTWEHSARNQIAKKGRAGYFLSRVFLPLRSMKTLYPVLDTMPFLLPFCWILRLVRALIVKPRKVLVQLKAVFAARKSDEKTKEEN